MVLGTQIVAPGKNYYTSGISSTTKYVVVGETPGLSFLRLRRTICTEGPYTSSTIALEEHFARQDTRSCGVFILAMTFVLDEPCAWNCWCQEGPLTHDTHVFVHDELCAGEFRCGPLTPKTHAFVHDELCAEEFGAWRDHTLSPHMCSSMTNCVQTNFQYVDH